MILFIKNNLNISREIVFAKPVYILTNEAGITGSCRICPFLVPAKSQSQVAGQESGHGGECQVTSNIIKHEDTDEVCPGLDGGSGHHECLLQQVSPTYIFDDIRESSLSRVQDQLEHGHSGHGGGGEEGRDQGGQCE